MTDIELLDQIEKQLKQGLTPLEEVGELRRLLNATEVTHERDFATGSCRFCGMYTNTWDTYPRCVQRRA